MIVSGSKVLLLVVTFFGEPIIYMNASPFVTIEGCEQSGQVLNLPTDERINAGFHCEWRPDTPEAMPKLKEDFTPEQIEILVSIGWWSNE